MKKIIYSGCVKITVVILFVVCVVLGSLTITDGIAQYCNEKEWIYGFESEFDDTEYFSHILVAPEHILLDVYNNFYNNDTESLASYEKTAEEYIEQGLNSLYCADKINYYVRWNEKEYTNCNATDEKEFMDMQFYSMIACDGNGNVYIKSNQSQYLPHPLTEKLSDYARTHATVVCTSVKETYVNECKLIWDRQASDVNSTFQTALIYLGIALLLIIYLLCVCGKDKDGNLKLMWFDNIWAEMHFASAAIVGFGAYYICVVLIDEYVSGHFPFDLMNMVVGFSLATASLVGLTSLLSVARNIKCRRFTESSIIIRVVRRCLKLSINIMRWFCEKIVVCKNIIFRTLSSKTGIILISMLFVYTALIGLFGFLGYHEVFFIVAGVLLFGFAAFVVAYRAKDFDEIRKGASEVRNGNFAYKIVGLKSGDMKALADDINDIAKGLDNSVAAKVKAEKMKTELITNISHDLKTPLTSIINYTELLASMEGLPEYAEDYIRIIANKSNRLKILTQDLFDISKVQSGNESVSFEKLDISVLINQSLGEHDREIKESGLSFCINTSKELFIYADGRKLSRVMSNLINNILKYTLKSTRVFISAIEDNGEVVVEFKNIASYHMDFNADEIVGRFVRGDESRTCEGNGLGLAIAKSYTEICNGKFDILIDGDMFKAILKFGKI